MSEMSEVKRRYSLWWGSEEEEPYMVEDEDGKYAHYSDWQSEHDARLAAEQERDEARAVLVEFSGHIHKTAKAIVELDWAKRIIATQERDRKNYKQYQIAIGSMEDLVSENLDLSRERDALKAQLAALREELRVYRDCEADYVKLGEPSAALLAAYRELEKAAREIRREGIDEYWGATYGLEAVMKFDAALAKLEEVRDAPAESHHVKLGPVDYKAKVFVGPDGKLHLETSQDGGKTWETKTLDCPVILEEAPDAQP